MKREFLMLAHEYSGQDVTGWFVSEKFDGMRAFWDGGISRGELATQVPWANTLKDARLRVPAVSTGLWSRYGKVIHAPNWWVERLPSGVCLDLELWMGRGKFQQLRSIVGSFGGLGWENVQPKVLDRPTLWQVMADGEINNANWSCSLYRSVIAKWCNARRAGSCVPANELSFSEVTDQPRLVDLDAQLLQVTKGGGEGLVLRRPSAAWEPKRSWNVLKVKPINDAEGTVVGFTWGRSTDKGSRHLGRMGALILRLEPGVPTGAPLTVRRLELSGFTDEERAVVGEGSIGDGTDASSEWTCKAFPRGSQVTFVYRELTVDGLPKEARYLRAFKAL